MNDDPSTADANEIAKIALVFSLIGLLLFYLCLAATDYRMVVSQFKVKELESRIERLEKQNYK